MAAVAVVASLPVEEVLAAQVAVALAATHLPVVCRLRVDGSQRMPARARALRGRWARPLLLLRRRLPPSAPIRRTRRRRRLLVAVVVAIAVVAVIVVRGDHLPPLRRRELEPDLLERGTLRLRVRLHRFGHVQLATQLLLLSGQHLAHRLDHLGVHVLLVELQVILRDLGAAHRLLHLLQATRRDRGPGAKRVLL